MTGVPARCAIVVAALAAGFGLGAMLEGRRIEADVRVEAPSDREPASATDVHRDAAVGSVPGQKPAVPAGTPQAGTTRSVAELQKRAAELLAEGRAMKEAGDGRGMVRVLRHLALLGEPGYEGALELFSALMDDAAANPSHLGVSMTDLFRISFSPDLGEFCLWVLRHPDRASKSVRAQIVIGAGWSPDIDAKADLMALLCTEKDTLTARRAIGCLRRLSAADLPGLAEALKGQSDSPEVADRILSKMSSIGGDGAWATIEAFASSANPEIASRARMRLRLLRPPATGALVAGFPPGTTACPLERGDIVLSWDGQQVGDSDQFARLMEGRAPGKRISVVVHRGDGVVTVEVDALPKWVDTKSVTAK